MDRVIGVGWDVGGWMGGKHGIAVAQWTVGSEKIQWLGSTVCSIASGKMFTPHSLIESAVKNVDTELLEESQIVVGIDAPLGIQVISLNLLRVIRCCYLRGRQKK